MRGFNLIELLICLMILAITALFAVPATKDFIAAQRANQAVNQVFIAIQLARSEAITRGEIVTLCPGKNTCVSDWEAGFFLSTSESNTAKDPQKQILRLFDTLEPGSDLYWRGFPNVNYLQISPTGFTRDQNGTFYYCPKDRDPRYARAVIVDQTGRARLSADLNGDGIHEGADGEPLFCSPRN